MDQPPTASPSRSVRVVVLIASLVVGALWVVLTHPLEGPVMFEINEDHGIHRYDLLAIVPPLAALAWWAAARRSTSPS